MASSAKSNKKDNKTASPTSSPTPPQPGLINANLKDLLCPFTINLKNLNQIKFESGTPRCSRTFFTNTLPRFLTFGEFLKPLHNFGNTNTSIFIYPIQESICHSNLNEIITDIQVKLNAAFEEGDRDNIIVLAQKKLEAENLRDEIASGFNALFEITVLSTVFANSSENLDYLSELYGYESSKSMINIKSLWSEQEIGFSSNLPFSYNKILKNNTFDSFAAATVFPFWSADISHSSGIPLGTNIQSDMQIFVDDFSPSLPNFNFFIFGNDFSNRRIAAKLFIARSTTMDNIQNLIIDPTGSYNNLTKSFLGSIIKLSPKANTIINPFDINPEIVNDDITGKEKTIINIDEKIEQVTNLLMTMARGPIKSQYVNNITREIIKKAVIEEYSTIGITSNPESLYSSQGANLIGTKITRNRKELPTIGSWYKRINDNAASNTDINYKYHYEFLIKYMKDFVKALDGNMSLFDGQTNFNLPENIPIITFDLSDLDETFGCPLATQALLGWSMFKYINSNSQNRLKASKVRVVVDNTSILIPLPEAVQTLHSFASKATNRNISFLSVSSNIKEFCNIPKLEALLKNAGLKLLMKHDGVENEYIRVSFNMTMGERTFLSSCNRNDGIMIIKNASAQISVFQNEIEVAII